MLFGIFFINSANCNQFEVRHLPKIVTDFILKNEQECKQIKDNNDKAGKYQIGTSISRLNFLNHNIEYIIYLSSEKNCSSSASFDSGNGGPHLIIFANLNKKWQKIHDEQISGYHFESPDIAQKTTPTTLIVQRKGVPGSTTEEVRYEWDTKTNCYKIKNTREDIYNLKQE